MLSAIFSYSLAVSAALILGLCAYRLSPEKKLRFSIRRLTLIAICVVSLVLPLLMNILSAKTGVTPISIGPAQIHISATVQESGHDIWRIPLIIWTAGVATVILANIISLLKIFTIIIRAERRHICGQRIYVTRNRHIAPFSVGNIIVISIDDLDSNTGIILSHEAGHIHYRHTLDMLMSQTLTAICWYNPAAWMLRREMKTVHEFQADSYVIDCGNNARDYQIFLVRKAARSSFPAIGNTLNSNNLKKRIMTMNEMSRLKSFSAIGLMAPATALALAAIFLSSPGISAALRESAAAELIPSTTGPSEQFNKDEIVVTGVTTAKKTGGDSLKVINSHETEPIAAKNHNKTSDVMPKGKPAGTPLNLTANIVAINSNMAATIAENINERQKETPEKIVVADNAELSKILILVDGKKITPEELKSISPTMIESISVNKSGEKPCIIIKLKK